MLSKQRDKAQLDAVLQRITEVEAQPLPANLGAALDLAVERFSDRRLCNFFDSGEILTHTGFRDRVDELAALLAAEGVDRGDHVAVLLPNIPEFPVSWFALARLGAVMVPMNTRLTSDEVTQLLTDSDASFVICHTSLVDAVDADATGIEAEQMIVIGDPDPGDRCFESLVRTLPGTRPDWPEVGLDDLIGIQYTSGTTGLPKGALQTHRFWLTTAVSMAAALPEPPKRILSDTPFFYIDPQFEFLMAMNLGSEIFVAERPSLSRFMERIREHRIDYCAFWENALALPEDPRDREHELRWSSTTGLPGDRHAELEERFGVKARELYGMTEIGMGLFMPWEAEAMVGSGSCGIAGPFREVKIIRSDGSTAAVGETGELCVRGPGVFLGYHRRPEVNRELISDDGWFRTGDLMTADDQGFHYFVGRVKDMIRRSHENISAREVEAVLEQIPVVAEAAAVPVVDDFRGEEVKAILVLADGADPADLPPETVAAHCEGHLAAFKRPRYLTFRESLPKTASGKIAKGRLKAEDGDPRLGCYDFEEGIWR